MAVRKVLVVAPHLDDEALGCGGAIIRHVERGDEVSVCVVAHRVYAHKLDKAKMEIQLEHARAAKQALGYANFHFFDLDDERLDLCVQDIIIPLEECFAKTQPELVYSPFRNDNNQDHRAVAEAVQVALRPFASSCMKKWLMYETPSSTDQASPAGIMPFAPNSYINIESVIERKLAAVACYETEAHRYPHPRSPEALKAIAMKRGIEAGIGYAEAFMLARELEG